MELDMLSKLPEEFVRTRLQPSITVIRNAVEQYGVDHVFLSFNGGKDSTVVYYILTLFTDITCMVAYFQGHDEFQEITKFVEKVFRETRLHTRRMGPNIREEMSQLTNEGYEACLMGVRSGDPSLPSKHLEDSSPNWPRFTRVLPILDWSYSDVWTFIRSLDLPVCELYSQGYTSIGQRSSTIVNPEIGDRPAWELENSESERSGRVVPRSSEEYLPS